MTNFDSVFVNFTSILLPIIVYLIYEVYTENVNKKKNNLVLIFCLLSSMYLIFRFCTFNDMFVFSIIFDLIILLFYINRSMLNAIIVSIVVLLCFYNIFSYYFYFILIKYVVYLILYISLYSKSKHYIFVNFIFGFVFLCLTSFFKSVSINIFFEYHIYYLFVYFIIILLCKAEKIIEINISYKELMKENQLRQSLFKISHEIKNPIAVCKGYLDMYDVNNISQFKKYIPIIKSEIDRTLNLLQDFSACNKIKLECDIIDITFLIEELRDNFVLLFNNKSIKFYVEDFNDEIYVYGDYNRLNQVFINIIKNSVEAIDYNKDSFIKIYVNIINDIVNVFIEDNGIGISADNIERISEPFYTTKQNGTGLGVLLSMEIIKAHGGNIVYDSLEGSGTTVTISLPIYRFN